MQVQLTGMNIAMLMEQTMAAALVASVADPTSRQAVPPPDAAGSAGAALPARPDGATGGQVDVRL